VADWFIAHLIGANIRIHEDLTNLLFDHDETRLARTLLRLARYGTQGRPQAVLPPVSLAKLARIVGTTPAKIGLLMKRFKRLGFIDARDGLTVHRSLLSVVLHE
jgi:CRP-like cAMP-binding protein